MKTRPNEKYNALIKGVLEHSERYSKMSAAFKEKGNKDAGFCFGIVSKELKSMINDIIEVTEKKE